MYIAICFLQDQTKPGKALFVVGRVISHLISFTSKVVFFSSFFFLIQSTPSADLELSFQSAVLALPLPSPPNFISSLQPNGKPKKEKKKRAILPPHTRNNFDITDYIISIKHRPSAQRITTSSLPRAPFSTFSVPPTRRARSLRSNSQRSRLSILHRKEFLEVATA